MAISVLWFLIYTYAAKITADL